ncbi:MAG TPA: hypothetical protein RMH99_12525 [Sandaracinaceae bacterium LLY-WYZ-13_1]|nr:hypothetical protein [Sandaracinaceae bacterium LLY-WYZ-13_1]
MGDPIRVALRFSSPSDGADHRVEITTRDRSGRCRQDAFDVQPTDGLVDPLAAYFADAGGIFGGPRREVPIAEEPEIVRTLNEHVRIDRPGRFALRVRTKRVRRGSASSGGWMLSSNEIRFEVVCARPEERAEKIQRAARVLVDPSAAARAKVEAARTLRFSGTRDAVDAMVGAHRMDERATARELRLGLLGAPDRAHAVDAMRACLAGEAPIRHDFLQTLSLLASVRTDAPSAGEGVEERARRHRTFHARWQAARRDLAAALVRALDGKPVDARATSARALAELIRCVPGDARDALDDRPFFDGIDRRLAAIIGALPPEQRRRLAAQDWKPMRDEPRLQHVMRVLRGGGNSSA